LHTHTCDDYRQLLANAPLWLDWQIQQIIKERDLKQATDFQQVSQQLVKLLKNIENKDTRSYYVSHCAEILSLGDTRLIPLRVENLLTQIAPATTYSKPMPVAQVRSSKPVVETRNIESLQSEYGLLEQAEALLLRIYLHCPEQRQIIAEALEERDLQFSLSHHRFLWRQILEIPSVIAGIDFDLVSTVQDRCLEFPEEMNLVSHLFNLNEKIQKEMLSHHDKLVQAAIACMEKVLIEKRYRHFLELWQQSDAEEDYQAFYIEKMRLQELNKQRLFSITDLI
jgi:DNA primase